MYVCMYVCMYVYGFLALLELVKSYICSPSAGDDKCVILPTQQLSY